MVKRLRMREKFFRGLTSLGFSCRKWLIILSLGEHSRRDDDRPRFTSCNRSRRQGKESGSMPNNPHNIKIKVVEEALSSAGITFGSLKDDPFGAITAVGDPMMPAAAGLICGAAENVPVLMAGGTQMGAVLNIVKSISPRSLDHVAIGTTRWILEDKSSSIRGMVSNIAGIPILAADLDFSKSRFDGLKAYELGWAK